VLQALKACRAGLANVALFTAVDQPADAGAGAVHAAVYDQVLSSRNEMTAHAQPCCSCHHGRAGVAAQPVVRLLGTRMDMGPQPAGVRRRSCARTRGAAGQMLDLTSRLRQFATGQQPPSSTSWFPVYLLVIFMFSRGA
jgi:ATP-binding cassette subfamily C exporter for protease/lipase